MSEIVAVCQLSQDGGAPGPRRAILVDSENVVNDVIAWAEEQIGHPWDCLLVSTYTDERQSVLIETYQIEFHDGSWECV